MKYIDKNWLEPYKNMFVSLWSNENLNFHEHTTNRAEAMHASLKSYLHTTNSTLLQLVVFVDEIVSSQEFEIRKSFEDSLIVTMNHHKLPWLDNLRGRVSHKALDLLVGEMNKLYYLQKNHRPCNCQLRKSCGLPCACMLADYEKKGRKIPLRAVDVFWRKLDFLESSNDEEEPLELEQNLVQVFDEIKNKPPVVQKSLLSKIKAVVFPVKTDKKAPIVQKQSRGRPSAKMQQQRKDDAVRNSSAAPDTQQSTCDPARHSSYIPSQDSTKPGSSIKSQRPVLQRSRSSASKSTHKEDDHGFPLINANVGLSTINRYKVYIPSIFHPYISHIQDVLPDGNCGFRALAVGMGMTEDQWPSVREYLMLEMDEDERFWRKTFDSVTPKAFVDMRKRLDWFDVKTAPPTKWMEMPYAGLLFAERYQVIVISLSINGSSTIFPITQGPRNFINNPHVVTIVHVPQHFISVTLQGEYPMPLPEYYWNRFRSPELAE